LRDVLYSPHRAALDITTLSEDFQELGEGLVYFSTALKESRTLAVKLSRGDLSGPLPSPDNELSSHLKSLHSTLKHLTWQTQQIARGDYEQRVEFMGDFAEAFNTMVLQLKERQQAAKSELEIIQKKSLDLERSNSLFQAVTENMSEWIVVLDRENGEHLFANHPATKNLANPILEDQLYKILMEFVSEMKEDDLFRKEEFPLISDFAIQYFSVMFYPIRWSERNAVAAVLTDTSVEKEQLRALENVAYRDMLTGAYNRHYGMKLLSKWMEDGEAFAICFIDMDRLKFVNDVFGHGEGDKYILAVSDLLYHFSTEPYVCRLGGDEFMVLAKGLSVRDAERRMETLREELVAQKYFNEDGSITYKRSLSYGVVAVTKGDQTPIGELLTTADERMYEYKRAHKAERREGNL
jgi:diguanylate cyclase (GGDEF)-like protein